jgi:hypothetical protein
VGFYGSEVGHDIGDDSGSVSCVTELKVGFDHIVCLLLQMNQFIFAVRFIASGLSTFPGTA